jgi:pimeloyl-ACP methyl ester carboxylesterase
LSQVALTDSSLLRSSWVPVEGLPIYTVAGGDGPPIVLVHGFGVSGGYMLPLARVLAESRSVLVPDLPGHGRSGRTSGAWGIPQMARVLGTWLETMGVREPILVANSMGCQVATMLAVTRPSLVGGLVLISPTVDPARRSKRQQLFGLLRAAAREPSSMTRLALTDAMGADPRRLASVARSVIEDPIENRLPLVQQPTIVIHGEADTLIGMEWAERVAALLPRGRLVVVPDATHVVHYTRPEVVAELVEALVEERLAEYQPL